MDTAQSIEEKIRNLPDDLKQEVNDFLDFLLTRQNSFLWQSWKTYLENLNLSEGDMPDYLKKLEDYEDRLAKGEIKW